MEERIMELEIKAAHQDKLLAELDGVVQSFAARVEKMERELAELRESADALTVGPADDPPPHY